MNAAAALALLYEERAGLADDEERASDEDYIVGVGLAQQLQGLPNFMSQSCSRRRNVLRRHGARVGGRRYDDAIRQRKQCGSHFSTGLVAHLSINKPDASARAKALHGLEH